MEHRKQVANNEIERRSFQEGVELRAKDGGGSVIRGYAARFGSVYDMGWFTEEVSRDAFKNADMSDVRVLFNHDPNQILGRTKSGTARIGVDKEGLWYEVELPKSADSLREAIERGDIDQSSWGFSLKKDSWTRGKGETKEHRILEEVAIIYDASPVTFPANPDTTVAKRSFDTIQRAEQEHKQEIQNIEAEIGILDALFEAEKFKNTL